MRLWPRSLQGQTLLALALALLVAQSLSAALLYRAQAERRQAALVSSAAFRLAGGPRWRGLRDEGQRPAHGPGLGRRIGVQLTPSSPLRAGERRDPGLEAELAQVLRDEDVQFAALAVVHREISRDPLARRWATRFHERMGVAGRPVPHRMILATIRRPDGQWRTARVFAPGGERQLLTTLVVQTLFLYLVLVGAMALLLRRITRPLAALTTRVERFAEARDAHEALTPSGPDDIRRLIAAHNAMVARIGALLDEKDVMLGAIGHDLKTPLAALRVRIESVENDAERAMMAATIEYITRSLDDILSLARVGRPSDLPEPTELVALAGAVVEEYEDLGEPVTLAESARLVVPLRATWLRRALRNLIDNALRYGERARVSLAREGRHAVIRIEDDGPGIPEGDIARMLEPFTRLEASRNSDTGGAGLGLTLARAIAEQHGGTLDLANRPDGAGLVASLRLPL
jgi:signal transduction histidine kinase